MSPKKLSIILLLIGLLLSFVQPFRRNFKPVAISTVVKRELVSKFQLCSHLGGLLTGVSNITESKFYSANFPIAEAATFLGKSKLFSTVAENNKGNSQQIENELKEIKNRADNFVNSAEVWGRRDLMAALNRIISRSGHFTCILAGKDTGKTFILESLEQSFPDKVFVVDLRRNPDILQSFIRVLRSRQSLQVKSKDSIEKSLPATFVPEAVVRSNPISPEFVGESPQFDKLANLLMANPKLSILGDILIKLSESVDGLTLVIDEANIALAIHEGSSEASIANMRRTLALFTSLTKVTNKLNIILVAGEHSFPFFLKDERLNFNLENLNGYIFAGEVSPKEMYELLTKRWGIRSNLAIQLISIYGGHIYDVFLAVRRLELMKEQFWTLQAFLFSDVECCLEWKGSSSQDSERMRVTLRLLAETGFAPLSILDDPMAKVISENDVGDIVVSTAVIIGLNPEVWERYKCRYGLVPSRQSMRLAIAVVLNEESANAVK